MLREKNLELFFTARSSTNSIYLAIRKLLLLSVTYSVTIVPRQSYNKCL
jgi:hypothetical protein